MIDRDDYKRLADELDGWHDCADGDVSAGNGHFRVVCESDSEQQRLNLRATLREAAKALRAASVKAGEVVAVRPLEWRPSNDELGRNGMRFETLPALDRIYHISETWHGQLGKVWQRGFDGEYFSTLDEAKAACQAVHDNRARSALVVEPVKGEPVAWLRYAVEDDAPKPCNEDDDGAFPVYRTATPAPTASVGAMREALERLVAIAEKQKSYFFVEQSRFPCVEDYIDDDGMLTLPDEISLLLSHVNANGRYSEADWWLSTLRSMLAAANQSDGGESFVTTNPDGSVTLDAYAGKTRVELKARCRELSMALNEWQFVAMEAATAHGNCLSNVPEHARAKIANMIEAYRDEDEPRPSDTPPAPQAVEAVANRLLARLTEWRNEDHEDAIVLTRSDVCTLLDEFKVVR